MSIQQKTKKYSRKPSSKHKQEVLQKPEPQKKTVNIISFDETGKFEAYEEYARLLGGFVYQADLLNLKESLDGEEKELEAWFVSLAERLTNDATIKEYLGEKEFRYPQSFHMSELQVFDKENNASKIDGSKIINKVRTIIRNSTIEYLKKKKYKYRLFALLVPFKDSMSFEASEETRGFELADFNNPGILYERLVTRLVQNFIFYGFEDVEENFFKIANRTVVLEKSSVDMKSDISKMLEMANRTNAVEIQNEGENTKYYFKPTDYNTFRASLGEKIFEKKPINDLAVKHMNLECTSLDYSFKKEDEKKKDEKKSKKISPFFYFSDLVCYYINSLFYNHKHKREFNVNSAELERITRDCAVPIFFWSYEKADWHFKQAVEAYAADRMAECFEHLYNMHSSGTTCCKYYIEFWEPRLRAKIEQSHIEVPNPVFRKRLTEELMYVERFAHNDADHGKMEYILENFYELLREGEYAITPKEEYHIQDLFLRTQNHHGSVEKSAGYFRRLLELSSAVDMETLTASINRAAQIYFNQFEYAPLIGVYSALIEDAKNLKTEQQERVKRMKQLITDCFKVENSDGNTSVEPRYDWLGKMYSSMGQAYAFAQKYDEAAKCFKLAIEEFAPEDEGNRNRTRGYLFHALISAGDKSYLKQSENFWESSKIVQQAKLLRGELADERKQGGIGYNLYLWLKGVYCFRETLLRKKEAKEAVTELIDKILYQCQTKGSDQHPWEMVCKYAFLLCQELGASAEKTDYFREACRKPGERDEEAVQVIKLFHAYQYESEEAKRGEAMKELERLGETLGGLRGLAQAEDKEAYLKDRLTYMYE